MSAFGAKRKSISSCLKSVFSQVRPWFVFCRVVDEQRFFRLVDEAKQHFADRGEPLKVQLIEEKGGETVSCYSIDGVFLDFCTGPHVPSSGTLKAFRVLTSSNAYWKGDAQNQPIPKAAAP